MTLDYRTVFISDTHLGSRGCQAAALSQFLKHVRCERLYLVGDIIDMWRLKQRWYWPGEHNSVLRRLLNHTKHHTDVIFVPGNHDEGARQFLHSDFGGIRVLPYAVHVTADGRKLLVIHGDQFDLVVKHSRFVSMLGGKAYEWLINFNRRYNAIRRRLGLPYRSISKSIKGRVKSACMFISKFEETLAYEARRRNLDGVVCGHIHEPAAQQDGPTHYFNCGDWVESCTALVEHHDGRMQVIDGVAAVDAMLAKSQTVLGQPDPPALAELIRCDRGLDLEEQWRVTLGPQTLLNRRRQPLSRTTPLRRPPADAIGR